MEIAGLGTRHIHDRIVEKDYGFLSILDDYQFAFSAYLCPPRYKLIDIIHKYRLGDLSSHFPESKIFLKVYVLGEIEVIKEG